MEVKRILSVFVLFFVVTLSFASENFKEGLKAFDEGEYENAAFHFKEHINVYPLDAHAYYNLGNAYYRQKKYPHARWAYEKTIKIAPNYEDANHNIKLSYEKTGLPGEWKNSNSIFALFLFTVHQNFWATMALTCALLLSLLFVFFFLSSRSERRQLILIANSLALLILITTLAFAFWHKNHLTKETKGIVITATANAKASPNTSDKTLFSIPGGQDVKILRTHDDWIEIKISAEHVGWIKSEEVLKY